MSQGQSFPGGMVPPSTEETLRETIEREPGVYRHSEVSGDGFKAFSLTSLLPKTGFDVHIAKMAE